MPKTPDGCDIHAMLSDPAVAALYLTDAMESGRLDEVAGALRDVQRACGGEADAGDLGQNLRLAEVLDILRIAGLRIKAVRASDD